MAGAHQIRAPMNIVDLRQTTVRQIEPLLEEEARHWRDELHWDYRGALELIKRFMEARALAGCVAFENGAAAGYSFYVLEEQKGLIGGLYVSCKFAQETLGRRLLEEMLYSMRLCWTTASISTPANSCCWICTERRNRKPVLREACGSLDGTTATLNLAPSS